VPPRGTVPASYLELRLAPIVALQG